MDVREKVNASERIFLIWYMQKIKIVGRDIAVSIATRFRLDGPGSNPGGNEIFRTHAYQPWGLPSLPYSGYLVFPGCKPVGAWRGVDHSPQIAPRLRKE